MPVRSANVLFRWWQPEHSGYENRDTWAIDEVVVDRYRLISGFFDDFEVRRYIERWKT